nr:hypothetical protein [Halomicronema hongdechloris]
MEEFSGELEGDEGFAGASGHSEQDSVAPLADSFEHMGNGVVLVVAGFPGAAFVFKGHIGEAIAPPILFAVGGLPQVGGGEVLADGAFGPGAPIDLVNAITVIRIGEAGF